MIVYTTPIIGVMIISYFIIYPLTIYTTIGNHIWFSDLTYWVIDRIKSDNIKDKIMNISYSKVFICRPCHSFWLTLILTSCILSIFISIPISLVMYLIIKRHDKKKN